MSNEAHEKKIICFFALNCLLIGFILIQKILFKIKLNVSKQKLIILIRDFHSKKYMDHLSCVSLIIYIRFLRNPSGFGATVRTRKKLDRNSGFRGSFDSIFAVETWRFVCNYDTEFGP